MVEKGAMPDGYETDSKEGVAVDVKKAEGSALHKLWKRRKKRTQAEFMESLDLSPGYFPQFFSGQRPITLKLAIAAASELDVEIVDFSPRLAKELDKALETADWPFQRLSRAQYNALSKAQKEAIEAFALTFLPEVAAPSSRKYPRLV